MMEDNKDLIENMSENTEAAENAGEGKDEAQLANIEDQSVETVSQAANSESQSGKEAAAENGNEDKGTTAEVLPTDKKSGNAAAWGAKNVTRTFMIIALAVTVLINAAFTAGITSSMLKKQSDNSSGMRGKGRPGNEMQFDKDSDSKGKKTPPGNGQNNAQSDQSGESSSKASIGVIIREDSGVYVSQISGDNAKKAGFQEGDKIVSIDGTDVSTSNDVISAVQSHKAGDTVTVTVERDGETVEIKTELE